MVSSKYISIFLLIISSQVFFAQKITKKVVINPQAVNIHIDAHKAYKLHVKTHPDKSIVVTSKIEGEYLEDLVVDIKDLGETILIKPDFNPLFSSPNDKLSAHKIVSIELEVILPNHKNVTISAENGIVYANGTYKAFELLSEAGDCHMLAEAKTMDVSTRSGAIFYISDYLTINPHSIYGQVLGEYIFDEKSKIKLNTVKGNIFINQKRE